MNNKTTKRVIIGLLLLGVAGLAYIYFFLIPSAGDGGIVSAVSKKVGKIEFLFATYGPGKGDKPHLFMPMSVATDAVENMYVTDSGNNRIVVFNSRGEYLFQFGDKGVAHPEAGVKATWKPGTFNYPYGIDVEQSTGKIFVGDMLNKRIQVFNSKGKFLDWFPKAKYAGMAEDIFPTDIAVSDGKVYVCNPYNIVVFDTEGNFVMDFGMPGTDDGCLDRPNGIDIGEDGTIYVSDTNNVRLQAFTPAGKFKWAYGKPAGFNDKSTRDFGLPRNLSVGPDGNIYVADAFHFSIQVFSPKGKKLAEMGSRGVEEGTFNFPGGIEVTKSEKIYVVEKENHRVQAIRLDGFAIETSET